MATLLQAPIPVQFSLEMGVNNASSRCKNEASESLDKLVVRTAHGLERYSINGRRLEKKLNIEQNRMLSKTEC